MKSHQQPYVCTECKYKKASQNDYMIHMLNHSKDVLPFVCSVYE